MTRLALENGRLDELTQREREILELVADGLSNQSICDRLFLSTRTVESHIRSIFMKLDLFPDRGAHRRVLAALEYVKAAA
jgi:DNA-binding NarL/FixJ family response regulator